MIKNITFSKKLLKPNLWVSWFAIGLWWLLTQLLPFRIQLALGKQLGNLLFKIGGSRVHIADRNIAVCYPELPEEDRKKLVRRILQETAIAIFESGMGWFWPDWRFKNKYDFIGKEHIQEALDNNKGVLFLGVHFTTIEIGASIVNLEFPISGFYRPHKNAVYEYIQAKGRTRRNKKSQVVPNEDVRGIIKALREGQIINYAPDQDYGLRRSVFAPFFNIDAATVKAPSQLASAGRAEVIPWVTRRDAHTHKYTIEILPSITHTLSKDDDKNATVINQLIEEQVRKNTEQYLWVHRRFKTRPNNAPSIY